MKRLFDLFLNLFELLRNLTQFILRNLVTNCPLKRLRIIFVDVGKCSLVGVDRIHTVMRKQLRIKGKIATFLSI